VITQPGGNSSGCSELPLIWLAVAVLLIIEREKTKFSVKLFLEPLEQTVWFTKDNIIIYLKINYESGFGS
jgi:hypothetical protein